MSPIRLVRTSLALCLTTLFVTGAEPEPVAAAPVMGTSGSVGAAPTQAVPNYTNPLGGGLTA